MTEYRRNTRACTLDHLRPELARAVRDHLPTVGLAEAAHDTWVVCETTSDKINTSRLDALFDGDPDTVSYLALILTPDRLIWARSGDHSTTVAASALLKDLRVRVFRPRGTQDFGLQLNVRTGGLRASVSGQLLMGPEPAAEKFCEELGQAMHGLLKLQPKRRPPWPGH
jgi:hypothetical protein